jgi:hypothetical protein
VMKPYYKVAICEFYATEINRTDCCTLSLPYLRYPAVLLSGSFSKKAAIVVFFPIYSRMGRSSSRRTSSPAPAARYFMNEIDFKFISVLT